MVNNPYDASVLVKDWRAREKANLARIQATKELLLREELECLKRIEVLDGPQDDLRKICLLAAPERESLFPVEAQENSEDKTKAYVYQESAPLVKTQTPYRKDSPIPVVLAYIKRVGGRAKAKALKEEVSEQRGTTPGSVESCLKNMKVSGLLISNGRGYYSLTEHGERVHESLP